MRATVTLDADVVAALHQDMAARGVTFDQALNDAIRAGVVRPAARRTSWTRPRNLGSTRADLDKALAVAAELEDASFL